MKIEDDELILVSACLAGVNCKYNGKNNLNPDILKLVEEGRAILVCPEQLGGLATPRNPSEIVNNKVIMNDGTDVTNQYMKGANETLRLAKLYKINKAILKAKSPSCGNKKIYDGTFTGNLIDGYGVTAKLLHQNGITVINEEEFSDILVSSR